jgi:hypothetical protein
MIVERDETHPNFLTEGRKVLIALVRERMSTTHHIDTSGLLDIEVLARIAIVYEIAGDEGLFPALDRLRDRFLDYTSLVGEMMMAAEGTRH